MDDSDYERFAAKIDRNANCWLWTAKRTRGGYGQMRVGSRLLYAHRLAYEHWVGPIPNGALICHTCDTPACVNPDHLYVGDYVSNARDMHDRLRARGGRPRQLTAEQVRAIRVDPRSHSEMARIYGVTKGVIAFARQGRTYKSVH